MTYDADGLRSTKQINGVRTDFQYVGDKLFYENRGNGDSFYYFYDSYGKLSAIYHHRNGTKVAYHVVTNAQGDVISLYNWSGTLVAYYEYDAWGNCTIVSDTSSTGIATLNPFRYRGYYYDTDLGLYYLQSRYYDAEIGRFINSDNVTDPNAGLMGYNTYVYCANNPVNAIDPTGHSSVKGFLDGLVEMIKSAPGRILAYCSDLKNNTELYGKLDNLLLIKDIVDFGSNCYDAYNDIQTNAKNVVGYAKDSNYQIEKMSSNITISHEEYTVMCQQTATDFRDYAWVNYDKNVEYFNDSDIKAYARNFLAEDKPFAGVVIDSYGEDIVMFVFDFCMP